MRSTVSICAALITVSLLSSVLAQPKNKLNNNELNALVQLLAARVAALETQAHARYTDAEAVAANASAISTAIGTHAANMGAHHSKYTDADAVAANASAISDAISTHASEMDAHHSAYTDADAIDAVDPTEVLSVFSRSNQEVYMTGANLHVVSGSGSTDGQVNGLGNIIIGYNEGRGDGPCGPSDDLGDPFIDCDVRSGSHMLVVGHGLNYSTFAGIVAGLNNSSTGTQGYTSVTAGNRNTASGTGGASVSGGSGNRASGHASSVSGGNFNTASGFNAAVSGGRVNLASGTATSVSGGNAGAASGFNATVSGGFGNTAQAAWSTVSGGNGNTATMDSEHVP